MIISYAKFSKRHPYVHLGIIISLSLLFLISAIMLIEFEVVEFAIAIVGIGLLLPFFAKASKYKQQYLSD
ncbi:hypothetical protein [Photobacterium sp. 1_MG-2023]|uniref:hypothetical protein n=1 Tax=Photobacterium sp. 1_MG-2023 TaxID=3062646 RepID=UPI0026E42B89|nr:hypothetical protein [Photobacterium sp. 1_MG-2023]MDO6706509.1 hypothetical protein [Photobacterium sp. 1_MG-2023]